MSDHDDLMKALDDADEQARMDLILEEMLNSPESKRERYRSAGRKRWLDPDIRAKMTEANRVRMSDPAQRAKVADANRKRADDPVWRSNNAESKRKLASDPVWLAKNAEANRKKAVPVVQVEASLVHIGARKCGNHQSAVTMVCRGRRATTGGYHWRYATPEEVAYFWAERERTGTDGPFKLPSDNT